MATAHYKFITKERVWLIRTYYQQNADYTQMFTNFTDHFPDTHIALCQSVWKMVTKFECTGSVADVLRKGCPRSVRSTDNTETVAFALIKRFLNENFVIVEFFFLLCKSRA